MFPAGMRQRNARKEAVGGGLLTGQYTPGFRKTRYLLAINSDMQRTTRGGRAGRLSDRAIAESALLSVCLSVCLRRNIGTAPRVNARQIYVPSALPITARVCRWIYVFTTVCKLFSFLLNR